MMQLDQLAFEVERFDFPDDDHLEVTGRWFGTGGRRFVRPTLHVRIDGRRKRMLALLDHKPWSPDDPTWVASFSWRGTHDGVTAVRLEVAPDIVLDLPAPGKAKPGTTVTPKPREPRAARKAPTAPKRAPAPAPASAADAPRREAAPPAHREAAPPAPTADAQPPAPAPRLPAPRREAAPPAPPADAPPPEAAPPAPTVVAPPPAADAAAELRVLVLERRLAEERGERGHLEEELAGVRRQLETQADHQASAVARAEEVVRLEGELAVVQTRAEELEHERDAANTRAQRAEAERNAARARLAEPVPAPDAAALAEAVQRAERAEAALERIDQPPAPLEPAARRIRTRTAAHRDWSPTQRIAVVAIVLVALAVFLILLLTAL